MLAWELTTDPVERDVETIAQGVLSYGRAEAIGGNARALACFARIDGALVAGGSGRTEFERLFVLSLWVTESLRGQGIGTMVLRKMEVQAYAAGCTSAVIETLSDRTAHLYMRLGYGALAVVPKYIGSFTKHILAKPLEASHETPEV